MDRWLAIGITWMPVRAQQIVAETPGSSLGASRGLRAIIRETQACLRAFEPDGADTRAAGIALGMLAGRQARSEDGRPGGDVKGMVRGDVRGGLRIAVVAYASSLAQSLCPDSRLATSSGLHAASCVFPPPLGSGAHTEAYRTPI